jgi:sulfide dehydrogenase [flavocytochrome c] flavoprotein subunit
MARLTRRRFNRLLAATGGAAALGTLRAPTPLRAAAPRVVVIGGGFGGATAAKYLRLLDAAIEVTLIEPKTSYLTCPFSNRVLGGLGTLDQLAQGYGALRRKHGVTVVHDWARALDPDRKTVALAGGATLGFDRAVVSPGIDFRWDAVEGASPEASERLPHAWRAGPQTLLLRRQLEAMPDGGTVLICPPANRYRCPPAPYERASLIAHYLKAEKPNATVTILDAKEKFSKQQLFMDGWEELYGDTIEWRAASAGGQVLRIDAAARIVETEFGEEAGDVINFIPPQQAGRVARDMGLADASGWCPVDPWSFESRLLPGVHVIGDSADAGRMPKSGVTANNQAKAAALAIVAALRGGTAPAPSFLDHPGRFWLKSTARVGNGPPDTKNQAYARPKKGGNLP